MYGFAFVHKSISSVSDASATKFGNFLWLRQKRFDSYAAKNLKQIDTRASLFLKECAPCGRATKVCLGSRALMLRHRLGGDAFIFLMCLVSSDCKNSLDSFMFIDFFFHFRNRLRDSIKGIFQERYFQVSRKLKPRLTWESYIHITLICGLQCRAQQTFL